MTGGDAQQRTTIAYCAAYGLLLVTALGNLDLREVGLDVSVVGVDLVGEAGLFGDGDCDGAVAVFNSDVAQGRSAGDVDRAVAVGDEDVSGNAVECDVTAVGGKSERADSVAGVELGVVADFEFTVETGELEVGAAGVKFDGAADVFDVSVAEAALPPHRHPKVKA